MVRRSRLELTRNHISGILDENEIAQKEGRESGEELLQKYSLLSWYSFVE